MREGREEGSDEGKGGEMERDGEGGEKREATREGREEGERKEERKSGGVKDIFPFSIFPLTARIEL